MRTGRGKAPITVRPASSDGRGARRRLETRSRLVTAARELMARKGIGATSIQEITDTADVGFGSFYNHFPSKEAIADAVMEDALEHFGAAADRLADTLDDPAEVLAASIRHAVMTAAADEAWGWFLVRTALTRANAQHSTLGQRLARDVQIGIAKHRFTTDDPTAAMIAAGGTMLAITAARLHGQLGDDAPERAATVILTLLGLPAREAHAIARRPLPPIAPLAR
ncbi:MAG TPA: TetR/AcrR family transcriptional regulator [Candidatus Binatia bacterium]|jgi:AcrR family transcriptional regulator|nr:TetR/AcrR family transcriptional regulator [Candidatus Binatia bacterium]